MRKKLKIVVDTNIFINSWFRDIGACNDILDLLERNKVKTHFSQDMIGELIYVTKKYAIKNLSSNIPRLVLMSKVSELFLNSNSVDTRETECPEINDPYDEMLVKCAIEGEVDYLVSDDFRSGMHELDGMNFKVVSSEEFVKTFSDEQVAMGE